ncbi:MAG: NAD(P)H-quinone oxidoreductase [Elainellaceae cyanobacterium]
MRAVVLNEYGGPEVLKVCEIPELEAGPGEVRVRVMASALNRADILQRRGMYPSPQPSAYEIPGLEFSGTIDSVGTGVTGWQRGDRVFGLLSGGGYAEQVIVPERMLMTIPENLSVEVAAAIPEVFFTAYDALCKANIQAGERVLIHAGASGVGIAATQLAKLMGAHNVLVTSRTAWKLEKCLELGADSVINTSDEEFDQAVLAITGDRGADVILDFVGANYLSQNLNAAALEGRIIQIATLSGSIAEINLRTLMGKRLRLEGTTLRSRPIEQKIVLTQQFINQLLPLFGSGRLIPIIDCSFSLNDIADAHRYMEANRNIGKILITLQ